LTVVVSVFVTASIHNTHEEAMYNGGKEKAAQADKPLYRGKPADHIAATKRLTLSITMDALTNAI
jgi:hypothetical protein